MSTSNITIENGVVTKNVIRYLEYDVYPREKYWLTFFNNIGYDWAPQLISFDDETCTLCMTYVGEKITKDNKPKDWETQFQHILDCLERMNIKHNDIKPEEVLVNENKLYLIDFGWMNIDDDWGCKQGFDSRVKPYHFFPDHTAFERIRKVL